MSAVRVKIVCSATPLRLSKQHQHSGIKKPAPDRRENGN
jgi:hypothetical protein